MRIICIDFETANNFTGSVCAIGVVVIKDMKIIRKKSWLIKPHTKYYYFNDINIKIHGIKKTDVDEKDEFDKLYNEMLKPVFENSILVAHNAKFDMSALKNVLGLYNIPYPVCKYICTCKIARKVWPNLMNFKLNTVSEYLKFDFKHHDAFDDAVACANILLNAMNNKKVYDVDNLLKSINMDFEYLLSKNSYNISIESIKKNKKDLTIESQKIISCVKRMKENHKDELIADVLKGNLIKEVEELKFNKLSTFGIMNDIEKKDIIDIINKLLKHGYLGKKDNNDIYVKKKSISVLKGVSKVLF